MDIVVTDPITGRRTGLTRAARRALRALLEADVPFCVIGAAALAARGLPRMTRDLDVTVFFDDAEPAWSALLGAGFEAATPLGSAAEPEPMIVLVDPKTHVEVDLLVASGDPEARVIEEASRTELFGVDAPVATLEHLLLLYLYSNQPKHQGDFAAIVQSNRADLGRAERTLAEMHPEMLSTWQRRVIAARTLEPRPERPAPRRRKRS